VRHPTPFSEAPTTNNYVAGEVSDLGDQYGDLMIAWAAYLAHEKKGESTSSQAALAEYQSGIQAANAVYGGTRGGNVEQVAT
jgi:hypothetical protein